MHLSLPAVFNVVCTSKDTEYSIDLPSNAQSLRLQARSADMRVAFDRAGSVADATTGIYFTIKAAQIQRPFDNLSTPPQKLYVAGSSDGAVLEVLAWS